VGLSQSELRRSLEFLREYCAPDTRERFVPRAVEGLFGLVGCEGVSCGLVDINRGEGSAVGYPAELFSPDSTRKSIILGLPELRQHVASRPAGNFMRFSDVMDRAKFHRTAMYNEHYRRRHVEDVAVLGFLDRSSWL